MGFDIIEINLVFIYCACAILEQSLISSNESLINHDSQTREIRMKIVQSHNCSLSANMCSYLPNYLTTVHPQAKVPLHLLVGDLRGGVLGGAPLLVDHDGILPNVTTRY